VKAQVPEIRHSKMPHRFIRWNRPLFSYRKKEWRLYCPFQPELKIICGWNFHVAIILFKARQCKRAANN